jgi:hypothetical protein
VTLEATGTAGDSAVGPSGGLFAAYRDLNPITAEGIVNVYASQFSTIPNGVGKSMIVVGDTGLDVTGFGSDPVAGLADSFFDVFFEVTYEDVYELHGSVYWSGADPFVTGSSFIRLEDVTNNVVLFNIDAGPSIFDLDTFDVFQTLVPGVDYRLTAQSIVDGEISEYANILAYASHSLNFYPAVPEPAAALLVTFGLALAGGFFRRKRRTYSEKRRAAKNSCGNRATASARVTRA